MYRLLLIVLLGFSTTASADQALAAYTAEYKVKFSVFGGRLTTRLVESGNGFEATHTLVTTGMSRMLARGAIEEKSSFSTVEHGLVPNRFATSDELTKDKTSADLEFDWPTSSVVGTVNDTDFRLPIEENTLDRVSIQYQLMADLSNGITAEQYQMFDIDEVKTLEIENIGSRKIKTSAGTFEAIGIRHQSSGSSRTTTFWLAAELGYAPALIEQHRNGKQRLKASLTSFESIEDSTAN